MRFFSSGNKHATDVAIGGPQASVGDYDDNSKQHMAVNGDNSSTEELPDKDIENGVKKAQAVTLTWTMKELYIAYVFVFLVFFVVSMEEQIQNNLGSYVTSSFSSLPLYGTTSIVSGIVGGVIKLPTAKFIDLIGRAEGFMFFVIVATMGLVMMAACRNVETYAAGQVFYWSGFNGISYVLDVFLADTSSLKNRALWFSFATSPYIATTWIGAPAAQSLLKTSGWPWGFGMFAIITPVICLPIFSIMFFNQRKAAKEGVLREESSGRTFSQSIKYYLIHFDVLGLLLVIAGFSLFLLPFSLASYQTKGYRSPMIIAMIVVGIVLLIAFMVYEKFFSPKPFIPFYLLSNPSVIGACLLEAFLFISFYQWDTSFVSYLQAVHGLSVTDSGYISNIYSIGSCFWGIVTGLAIRISGRFKWIAFAGLCLEMLGVGLMIHFRQPDQNIGYVIMCQIFIAFGGGSLVICAEMAVMAAAPQENVAGMLALIGLFSSVGGAIGQAIQGAIYQHKFLEALDHALPGNSTLNAELYGSLVTQLSYAVGTPERDAVIYAYGVTQKVLTISGTVFLVPCFVFIAIWQNFKVKELRKVKGRAA